MIPGKSTMSLDWPLPPTVRACITTRQGGISQPPFDHNNLALHVGVGVVLARAVVMVPLG